MALTDIPEKVVDSSLNTFNRTPMLLALVLVNLAIFVMLTYLLIKNSEVRSKERQQMMMLIENCVQQNAKILGEFGKSIKTIPLPPP